MKISELAKIAEATKETIHFHAREGLLPKPRKLGRDTADHDESRVERIKYIKEPQDRHFLPLSEIKKIIKRLNKGTPLRAAVLQPRGNISRPWNGFCPARSSARASFHGPPGIFFRRPVGQARAW
ncbi:MAG: MerR family transcriptional regulator [Pseudomonadota bacterium]